MVRLSEKPTQWTPNFWKQSFGDCPYLDGYSIMVRIVIQVSLTKLPPLLGTVIFRPTPTSSAKEPLADRGLVWHYNSPHPTNRDYWAAVKELNLSYHNMDK